MKRINKNRNKKYWLVAFIGLNIGGILTYYIFPLINDYSKVNREISSVTSNTHQINNDNMAPDIIERAQNSTVKITNHDYNNAIINNASGVIYKKTNNKAYIITNNHVIQNTKKILVTLRNKNTIVAKLIGTDKLTDISILEIHNKHVDTVANLGESKNIKTGDRVFAIGSPLGLIGTVTSGIISNTNRTITKSLNDDDPLNQEKELIQTDAATNPGNNGGGLFDINGKLIGITSQKISKTNIEGISFAIPISIVRKSIQDIEKPSK
ncbi:TPA: trypsin-like peptidase domain-containing protein [Bacillus tropicus]|uniref:S1C family serine protease n=1 Tax=Bacillus cereus group TaxID=86661 RepID=UPI00003CB5BF|nr:MULTISPECIES: trypsin-like peptidase domain-containing protein [Bacillus cereus group]AIY72912.1 trypsin family protein [Bacillus cereus]AJI08071.1 trypsin family protein [Bacillus cereus G9241]EAL15962.1 serine protease DO [Bacillus cereus G9241]QPS53447.1 trypsin-like peptidase domain-containing protein [Bacillus tropicus]